ncbi:MAG: M6 family metalloprotease domain-containing protein [Sporocytophaga sp.]|nr:M6 family metalloprotease domain-containing protein [Sporocytophaga sp.]
MLKKFTTIRSIVTILLIGIIVQFTQAAPYRGDQFELKQPDGSFIKVKVWGDEFYQRIESEDGYTLTKEEDGWIYYALLSEDGQKLISTGVKYTGTNIAETRKNAGLNASKLPKEKGIKLSIEAVRRKRAEGISRLGQNKSSLRTSGAQPGDFLQLSGNVKGLALLIDFADEPATIPASTLNNLFNQNGFTGFGNNGSIRDYFYEVSGGQLDYTNEVLGYYRSTKPKSYYATQGTNVHELLQEVLAWANTQFDFSNLTTTNGEVIAINFMYTGDAPWQTGLWPHKSGITFYADGVHTGDYQITNIDTSPTIATLCHENGHMLFNWPDFYDTDYNSFGLGDYCLMAYQGSATNPVYPNAYLRMSVGWETPVFLNDQTGNITVTANSHTPYIYMNTQNRDEMFVIEARTKTGRHAALRDEGLFIWHVDLDGRNYRPQRTPASHYQISIEQADGAYDLENYSNGGDANDLFDASSNSSFNATSFPNSNWWDGSPSGLNISNISAVGSTMTFDLGSTTSTACRFGTPLATSLPTIYYSQYNRADVIGSGGPNLSNMRAFAVNWDAYNNGLWNFSIETNNGVPTYYLDLRLYSTVTFNTVAPKVTISGSNIPRLDGTYYVGRHNGNFVLSELSGAYTIYFSNGSSAPVCPSSSKMAYVDGLSEMELAPNPASDYVELLTELDISGVDIKVVNELGTEVAVPYSLTGKSIAFDIRNVKAGYYSVSLKVGETFVTKRLAVVK